MRVLKKEKEKYIFEFHYNKNIVEDLKKINFHFNPITKNWEREIIEVNELEVDEVVKKHRFTIHSSLKEQGVFENHFISSELKGIIKEHLLSYGLPSQYKESFSKLFNFKPRDYQFTSLAFLLDQERCILGDDMGCGKTFEAIMPCVVGDLFPCLVICPASLKYRWKDEWRESSNITPSIVDEGLREENKVWIVNYERLGKVEDLLKERRWRCVIVDESHFCKNSKAQRTKNTRKLLKNVPYIFLLSGTIVTKKPVELWNQIDMLGRGWDFGGWKRFTERYCGAHKTPFGMDVNGATNIGELARKLQTSLYLRREKKDVIKDMPSLHICHVKIDINNRKEYVRAERDFISFLRENETQLKVDSALKAESLVQQSYLRQLASKGKLKTLFEWIDNFMDSTEEKLIVFGIFKDQIKELKERYKCGVITGGVTAKEKDRNLKSFIEGEQRLLVLNIKAGSVGLDGMQKVCSTGLLYDIPDIPGDEDQLHSRLHRSGQHYPVTFYHLEGKGTIDEKITETNYNKRIITEALNKGKDVDKELITNIVDLYKEK